jgi:hypothetical protein
MEEPIWDISADMTTTASPGGCQCGQFRYEIDIERALTLVACHCRECQKQSASAFGLVMPIPRNTFTRLQGELKIWERVADSGRRVENLFCPQCGTRIYHSSSLGPDFIHLRAGTLDDTSKLRPAAHVWTDRAQPWFVFPLDQPRFAREPSEGEKRALVARR